MFLLFRLLVEMALNRLLLVDPWKCSVLVGPLQPPVYLYESNYLMLLYVIIQFLTYSNTEIILEAMVELVIWLHWK